jgi:hypothetical protein
MKLGPFDGSNRLTAFINPRRATWVKSSRLSPRRPKWLATWSASGRHRAMMRSRCRPYSCDSAGIWRRATNMSTTSSYESSDFAPADRAGRDGATMSVIAGNALRARARAFRAFSGPTVMCKRWRTKRFAFMAHFLSIAYGEAQQVCERTLSVLLDPAGRIRHRQHTR